MNAFNTLINEAIEYEASRYTMNNFEQFFENKVDLISRSNVIDEPFTPEHRGVKMLMDEYSKPPYRFKFKYADSRRIIMTRPFLYLHKGSTFPTVLEFIMSPTSVWFPSITIWTQWFNHRANAIAHHGNPWSILPHIDQLGTDGLKIEFAHKAPTTMECMALFTREHNIEWIVEQIKKRNFIDYVRYDWYCEAPGSEAAKTLTLFKNMGASEDEISRAKQYYNVWEPEDYKKGSNYGWML